MTTSRYYLKLEQLIREAGLFDPTKGGNGPYVSAAWDFECAYQSEIEKNTKLEHLVKAAMILLEYAVGIE